LGDLEGREEKTYMIAAPTARDPGVEQGSFTGRNPKKLKHRRLDAVEVAERELRTRGTMEHGEDLDVKGLEKLLEAQSDRQQAEALGYKGATPQRQWTMEDLDKEFPTEEGNRRLGVTPPDQQQQAVQVTERKRWERSSHLVDMRKAGQKAEVLPGEAFAYTPRDQKMVLFVAGSTQERYAIEAHEDDTVADFKSSIWAMEREYRYPDGREGRSQKAKDEASGFKIESQDLWLNGSLVESDHVTLKYLHVENYDIFRLFPKPPETTEEEMKEVQDYYVDILWWHERLKVWEEESDSDEERDPMYKEIKQAYLKFQKERFKLQSENLLGFRDFQRNLLKDIPNFGMMPHPWMTEEESELYFRDLENMHTPEGIAKMQREIDHCAQENNGDPSVSPHNKHSGAADDDEADGTLPMFAAPEFLENQVDPSLNDGVVYYTGGKDGKEDGLEGSGSGDEEDSQQDGVNAMGGRKADWAEETEHYTFDLPAELVQEVKENWTKLHKKKGPDGQRERAEMSTTSSKGSKKKSPDETSSESEQFRDHPIQLDSDF